MYRTLKDKKPSKLKDLLGFPDFFGSTETTVWCPREDSNLHGVAVRTSKVRLPIRLSGRVVYCANKIPNKPEKTVNTKLVSQAKRMRLRPEQLIRQFSAPLGGLDQSVLRPEILGRFTLPVMSDVAAESQTCPYLEWG
jgi:hypothetical protein